MSSGLSASVDANTTVSASKKGITIDILDELGVSTRENEFNMRTLALASPKDYAREREVQVAIMKDRVTATYESVRKDLEKSVLPLARF